MDCIFRVGEFELPADIMHVVMSNFSIEELFDFRLVSKNWNVILLYVISEGISSLIELLLASQANIPTKSSGTFCCHVLGALMILNLMSLALLMV